MELPGKSLVQGFQSGGQSDGRAAGAVWGAVGSVGERLQAMGERGAQIADRLQRVENGRIISEKRQQLTLDAARFQADLQQDTDPQSRLAKTEAFLKEYEGALVDPSMPPDVRDALREHFGNFSANMMENQIADSTKLHYTRGSLALQNELKAAKVNRDRSSFQQALTTGESMGFIVPEQKEAMLTEYDREEKMREFQAFADQFPLEAEKQADSPDFASSMPGMSPEELESLRAESQRKANRYRADFANDIIISGQTPTLDELRVMEDAGQIDKELHARWASKIRSDESPQADPAIYEETYAQIMSYDPANDPSGRGEAEIRQYIATQPLPKEQISVLNDKFSERLNVSTTQQPKSVFESEFSKKIQTDFTRGDWGKYRFPVDHDNDPSTPAITPINKGEYDKAWRLRGQFTDEWRGILKSMPEDASFEDVNKAYEALKASYKDRKPMPDLNFSKPVPLPFNPQSLYQATKPSATFAGQPIRPPGGVYSGAAATVFGGKNDPADNGKSAFGGTTGAGGREGTAIPQKLLESKFPGKGKDWIADNVRTVVRAPDGTMKTLSVADFGTAEWVWERNGRPTLDLTEGAAKRLGGQVSYTKEGKLAAVTGLDNLSFAVVSTATKKPLKGMSWEDAKSSWFEANRPTTNEQVEISMIALRDRWNHEQLKAMGKPEAAPASLPDETKVEPISTVDPKATQAPLNTGDYSQYNVQN